MKRVITILIIAAGLAGVLLTLPVVASADVAFSISSDFGPPPLPYYPRPPCPGAGFIWVPGYWGYDEDDGGGYFWVPGTWVLAPAIGLLWTPGWWGWYEGRYWWHEGYWGPRVGYYGGIDYGYGYPGEGYDGGYWRDDDFHYNHRADRDDDDDRAERVSYNGGEGGIDVRPTVVQQGDGHEQHFAVTEAQLEQERAALHAPGQHWSVNHGVPPVAATTRPGEFDNSTAVRSARQLPVHPDTPVAHATPGYPSSQSARRIEALPAITPAISHSHVSRHGVDVTIPEQEAYRHQTQLHPAQPVRIEAPHVQIPVTVVRHQARDVRRQHRDFHRDEKAGRPPR